MSYGIADFDFYPKGTTALIAPRKMLMDAFDAFDPTVDDWHKVNDDTAVLRWVAERVPINISPDYRSTYNARTTVKAFLKHAEHRGTVLIDGYLRPGARFADAIVLVLAATPVGLWFLIRHPIRGSHSLSPVRLLRPLHRSASVHSATTPWCSAATQCRSVWRTRRHVARRRLAGAVVEAATWSLTVACGS